MTKKDLIGLLVDEKWQWQDHTEQGIEGVAFRKEFNDNWIKYHLSNEGIDKIDKNQLLKRLRAHDVYWMSRVVGYFARIGNWNKSKLGELEDRHKGAYKI